MASHRCTYCWFALLLLAVEVLVGEGKPRATLAIDLLECGPLERMERCNICLQPSCKRPLVPNRRCPIECVKPGCVCIEGYVRDNRIFGGSGECIPALECME